MFTSKYRYPLIVLLAGYSYLNTLFSEVYAYYHIQAPWYMILGVFVVITLLVWECNRLMQALLSRYFPDPSAARFLALFFGSGMVLSVLVSLVVVQLAGSLWLGMPAEALRIPRKLAFTYATRINLFLHISNAILLYLGRYRKKELEAEELRRISAQAQLQAIKNQVNPHFLFNNLNVLSSMVMQENPEANKFIEEFSVVYRHVLNSHQQELIELRTELEFLGHYIFLIEKRFPDSIRIDIEVPAAAQALLVIPVALQMLVENAIKHNVASRSRPLHIRIETDPEGMLRVSNNMQIKFVDEPSTQFGLKNIQQRYELVSGKKIIIRENGAMFSVSLPLIQSGA